MKIAGVVIAMVYFGVVAAAAASEMGTPAPVAPRLLSETGLYADAARLKVDPRNRNFSPQYPLWSDGANKQRWIQLPAGSQIDTRDLGKWDFPVGTKFWKEFSFKGRKVETRFLWRTSKDHWVFASYAWNEAQTDAELASETGIANIAEIADGRRHSIPSVTRTALGYLSTNCGNCHNRDSSISSLGLDLRHVVNDRRGASLDAPAVECTAALATTVGKRGHWVVPEAPEESRIINPGRPEASALVRRVKSRRPLSQMPPIGTVVADRQAVDLLTMWVAGNATEWKRLAAGCATQQS